jgi:hypothetical protein
MQPAYDRMQAAFRRYICIRSVNSPIANAGLNSGVDPGITGVDALHAGCIAGVDALKNTP